MKSILYYLVPFLGLAIAQENSQSVSTVSGSDRRLTSSDAGPTVPSDFTGSTIPLSTTIAISSSSPSNDTISGNSTTASTPPGSTTSTTTSDETTLLGGTRTRTHSSPSSDTAIAPLPTNTQPCNNYAALCPRKYSNITEVAAHNSPFSRPRNVASNQQYGVTQQLNDGIRVLQGQAHLANGTLYYCHTSCDLLNAGPVEDYLREVVAWLDAHPFEVLTIIFGNYDWRSQDADGNRLVTAVNFATPVENSGLLRYIYQPPKTAMTLADWPTLGELILAQKRVIAFIDYNADTDRVPWLLWEFYNVWETPFSPTDLTGPCVIGRPDGLGDQKARDMLYMANHNLNAEVRIGGVEVLVPNVVDLGTTNGVEGNGSLGSMVGTCTGTWGRPPNYLLVDYYNIGSPENGSVFKVAALANGVEYNRECCGQAGLAAGLSKPTMRCLALMIAVVAALLV